MELAKIVIAETNDQQIIVLRERDGERRFPIIIGSNEALAINRRLKDQQTPRPLTHELLASVVAAMGGEFEKIVVNDLRDHTFYATIFIRRNGELLEVDARPSDAIALSAGTDIPIFVAEHVLREVTS